MFMLYIIPTHIVNDNHIRFYHNFTNKSKSKIFHCSGIFVCPLVPHITEILPSFTVT